MIYHLTSESEWEEQLHAEFYVPYRYKIDGFIHCSSKDQIQRTANTIFKNCKSIWLLHIEEQKEIDYIKYENLEGGVELFPHIYRALPKTSIKKTEKILKTDLDHFKIELI